MLNRLTTFETMNPKVIPKRLKEAIRISNTPAIFPVILMSDRTSCEKLSKKLFDFFFKVLLAFS